MKHVASSTKRAKLLQQFNGLMRGLLDGDLDRNSFRLWEAEILLDILTCSAEGDSMRELLHRYQKAAQQRLARGSNLPMRLSEYLESTAKHSRHGGGRAA